MPRSTRFCSDRSMATVRGSIQELCTQYVQHLLILNGISAGSVGRAYGKSTFYIAIAMLRCFLKLPACFDEWPQLLWPGLEKQHTVGIRSAHYTSSKLYTGKR